MHNFSYLSKNWLDINTAVSSLYLSNGLNSIAAGAFNATIFMNLSSLTMVNLNVPFLNSHMFEGLGNLKSLEIHHMHIFEIADDTFSHLVDLRVFNFFSNSKPMLIQNITGNRGFGELQALYLYNNIINEIPGHSFAGVPTLRTLHVSRSQVHAIDGAAFAGLPNLAELRLDGNNIRTMNEELLDNLLIHKDTRLFLENNPFECDCNLLSLKRRLNDPIQSAKINRYLICFGPVEWQDHFISSARFCETAPTEPSITTKPPPPVVTALPPVATTPAQSEPPTAIVTTTKTRATVSSTLEYLFTTEAVDPVSSTVSTPTTPSPRLVTYNCPRSMKANSAPLTLVLRFEGGHKFKLTELAQGRIRIKLQPHFQNYIIFWFENTLLVDKDHYFVPHVTCRVPTLDNFVISGLAPGSIYTFCITLPTTTTLSPFDCLSIFMAQGSDDDVWLKRDDQIKVFLIVTSSVILVLIISVFATCYCIRHSPQLPKRELKTIEFPDEVDNPPLPKRNSTNSTHKRYDDIDIESVRD